MNRQSCECRDPAESSPAGQRRALRSAGRAAFLAVVGWVALAVALVLAFVLPARAQSLPSRQLLPNLPAPVVPLNNLGRANAARLKTQERAAATRNQTHPSSDSDDSAPPMTAHEAAAQQQQHEGPLPFGANLFVGNFLRARETGLNPNYVIMPGDHVAVRSWGAASIDEIFVVDGQGNIFLPQIGPVHLAGVKNAELTGVLRAALGRVYARHFDVYTNLMSAGPVAVFVTGGVNQPGRYAGLPSDSLLFFLDQAGGIDTSLGSYRKIAVLRGGSRIAEVDLYEFLLRGELASPQFKEGDTILVERRGPVVELSGDVAQPALLEFKSEPIAGSDALRVIPGSARASELTVRGIRDGAPIERTMSLQQFGAFVLHHGDSVTLREDGRAETILVRLEGEFSGPSVLAVKRGSGMLDVLNHVPIDPKLADPRAVHLRRGSVARAQKDAIDDSLFRLERSALLALSASANEANIRAKEAELTQKFVERARLIQPLGRLVTSREGQQLNVMLEPGDVIVVPPRSGVVRVGGEVMMAQAMMIEPGAEAADYIERSGGYSERADKRKVIVLHSNAEVEVATPGIKILPGDEILVPPRIDSKNLQNIADLTQTLYQIAIAAAVVLTL